MNGEVPPGPWSPPWPFAGGLGAGCGSPLGVRPQASPPWPAWWGRRRAPPGGGLWIAGGRFVPPWRGLPFQMALLTPGRGLSGEFSTKRPPSGENGWPTWASSTGMEALLVLGHALAGGRGCWPPWPSPGRAPPRRGGVSGGVSPHPAEKAPRAAPGRRARFDGARGEPTAAWGRGAPGPSSVRRTVGTGAGSTLRGGAGAAPGRGYPTGGGGSYPLRGAAPRGCPAMGLHFSCEKWRKEHQGLRPWTPVFKAARCSLAPSFGIEAQQDGSGFYRDPPTGPDLETFFFEIFSDWIFPQSNIQQKIFSPKMRIQIWSGAHEPERDRGVFH